MYCRWGLGLLVCSYVVTVSGRSKEIESNLLVAASSECSAIRAGPMAAGPAIKIKIRGRLHH